MWWKNLIFLVISLLLSWFGIGAFLGGKIAGDFIFNFFPGTSFNGVTLSPVTPDKMETSVRILLSIIIKFGADGSDWLIKFVALVTFCVLIDYLGIMPFQESCASNLYFSYFPLSLDDYEYLVIYSSSKSSLAPPSPTLVLPNHYSLEDLI